MISPKIALGAHARPHAIGRQLVARGNQVTLLLVAEKERWHTREYDWDGVRAIESPHISFGRLRYGWDPWNALTRIVFLSRDKQAYDLIHCFETRPANVHPALWFSNKEHIPLITDWNDWFGRKGLAEFNRPLWYRILNLKAIETYYEEAFRPKAAGLTVISTTLAERAVKLGVKPERICHISGGVFLDRFILRSKEECRQHIGLPSDIPILGFSSSDSHFDLEIIMAALAKVTRVFPEIKLIITGKARPSVHELVEKYRVSGQVLFVGYLPFDELPWYLGCADLFLLPMADLPYNRGRWPNKLCEYMSLGRPTIANPVGDVKKLFERHPVGLLAGWESDDFAEKIITLVEDRDLSCELGETARRVAETEYDWRILIEKLEQFYYKICKFEQHPISERVIQSEDAYDRV